MTIAASILFDPAYLEAALLTAHELRGMDDVLHRVYLVLLEASGPGSAKANADAAAIVHKFCIHFNGETEWFCAIKVQNTIAPFSADHFSNAIVYKALLPSMLADEPYLLNIDAGLLPGDEFHAFVRELDARYCQADGALEEGWVVGAHCVENVDLIPHALALLPAHTLYPAGNVLLFHTARYQRSLWSERFLAHYEILRTRLEYAEQELICLTAQPHELLALPGAARRTTPFLGLDVLLGEAAPLPESATRDCLFFKFVGSFKPWKYWVLDPNKALYTRRRAALEQHFDLGKFSLVHDYRNQGGSDEFRLAFLEAYDRSLRAAAPPHEGSPC